MSEGKNILEVIAVDEAGHSQVAMVTVIRDTTAPEGSITLNGGDAFSTSSNVTLGLNVVDQTSGVNRWRYCLKG